MIRHGSLSLKVTRQTLYGVSLVLFFAQEAFRVLLATVMPFLSYNATVAIMIFLMYFPLLIALGIQKGRNMFVFRFFLLLVIVLAIFVITYLLHPEYSSWFFGGSYPVGERIFRPNQFLYAFLFVSALEDPEDLIKYMKIVAYILLAYYSYRLLKAQSQGYWVTTTTGAGAQRSAYDLSFGYDHLLVFSVFCCCAFRERKKLYFIPCGISLIEILMGGSRGPLLGIMIMLLIMYLLYRKTLSQLNRALILIAAFVLVIMWVVLGIEGVLMSVGLLFDSLGISSRTINKLLLGSEAFDLSGRDRLYGIAVDMIKDGFWGYGAYGDRYVIGRTFWVGYAHNIFLEMLIDFGWIGGSLICIKLLYDCVVMIFFCKDSAWRDIFIILFIPCTKLPLSGSFWYSEFFFACIAINIMYKNWLKRSRYTTLTGKRT